jgi:hypothetical protein
VFTLMKVIGRAIWIGVSAKADAREICARFPKFVIGFVIASALVTWIASHYSLADYRKVATPEFVAPRDNRRQFMLRHQIASSAPQRLFPRVAFVVAHLDGNQFTPRHARRAANEQHHARCKHHPDARHHHPLFHLITPLSQDFEQLPSV